MCNLILENNAITIKFFLNPLKPALPGQYNWRFSRWVFENWSLCLKVSYYFFKTTKYIENRGYYFDDEIDNQQSTFFW